MTSSPASIRPSRPLGVWILCGYGFLIEGLVPASAMAFFTLGALRAPANTATTALLALLVGRLLISIGIAVTSISAFSGRKVGAWSLVALLTLSHLLAVLTLPLRFVGPLPAEALPGLILGGLNQAIAPIIYVWYFTRRRTRSFYVPHSES